MSRIRDEVRRWWEAERRRHFLWYPVAFAAGIAIYFSLGREPDWRLLAALSGLLLAGCASIRRVRPWMLLVSMVAVGATLAAHHTAQLSVHVLAQELTPRPLQGVVEDVERTENGVRLTLGAVQINRFAPEETPERVRLTVRPKKDSALAFPAIGNRIEMLAGLLPPMGPAMPHGFDFARYFYFREIGAVGYGLPPWKILGHAETSATRERFSNWRLGLTERIIAQLGPRNGPIAAGLITGEDRAILETDYDALKASNLYHIIAISGGHMVVIAGMIFLLARMLLLVLLPATLRYRPQSKSIAAAITLLMITVYLFVTGLPVSAVRAYGMILFVLFAVLLRRQVDSMRSLFLAAWIMLLLDPSDLFEPGFQLSFVATLAIVALVEAMVLPTHGGDSKLRRCLRLLAVTMLISVVAEAATAPLVIAQFNMASSYGVLANMVATPLVSFFIMPLVGLFFLLLPFGAESLALSLMNTGIDALLAIAHSIAALPHAQWFIPSPPGWGVALFVVGLLWFCIWQQRPRFWGLWAMLIALASIATVTLPDMLVGQAVKQLAFKMPTGYALVRGRADSMIPNMWANGLGMKEFPRFDKNDAAWRCDALGCVATVDAQRVAFPEDAAALRSDCEQSAGVITPLWKIRCKDAWVIDGADLRYGGIHAVWVGDNRRENSQDWGGVRPWSAH